MGRRQHRRGVGITTHSAQDPYRWPRLRSRWQDRASRLGLTSQPAVTFPEVVALAQVLTDLDWRCHVAMVREWQLDLFYQRIARRLGEPFCQAPSRSDPIVTRAVGHRNMFARIRDNFCSRHERQAALAVLAERFGARTAALVAAVTNPNGSPAVRSTSSTASTSSPACAPARGRG
jgi:hypothetical protein